MGVDISCQYEHKHGRLSLVLRSFLTCRSYLCLRPSCRPCLTSCWTLAIEEGDVKSVSCPSVDCVKRRATTAAAPPTAVEIIVSDPAVPSLADEPSGVVVDFRSVVRDLLGDELYDRWIRLAEKKRIESDPTFTFCPIASCEAPVPAPPASESTGDRWSRYRSCPACSFSFCLFCRLTWFVMFLF